MRKMAWLLLGLCVSSAAPATATATAFVSRPGVEGSRVSAVQDYLWVGKLERQGSFFCAAWILDHGTAITAKHCFEHNGLDSNAAAQDISDFSLRFGTSFSPVYVDELSEIHFDTNENDIVILHYSAEATSSQITLPSHEVFKDKIPKDIALTVVGFPGDSYQRVASVGCRTTGYTGTFTPKAYDPGYDGIFDDTTCGAWYGVSGGAVFHQNDDGHIIFYGVLTHTFDVLSDGNLNPDFIKTDEFGEYTTGMFSAFSRAADL